MSDFLMFDIDVVFLQNAIKDPHRYAVQVSDTTMMARAVSLFGQ